MIEWAWSSGEEQNTISGVDTDLGFVPGVGDKADIGTATVDLGPGVGLWRDSSGVEDCLTI